MYIHANVCDCVMLYRYISLVYWPLPVFQCCKLKNIEKLGAAWGRGYRLPVYSKAIRILS